MKLEMRTTVSEKLQAIVAFRATDANPLAALGGEITAA
jgi:hypothetical protein